MTQNVITAQNTFGGHKTTGRKRIKRSLIANIRELISIVLIIASIVVMTIGVMDILNKPEKYMTTAAYHLRLDLNNGDTEAIEYYRSVYIENNDYLFDGPLTIRLMAEQYGIDGDILYNAYTESDYDNAQDFYKNYVRYLVTEN